MSGSVDNRIVAMRFENSAFATGAQKAMGILSKLQQSLGFKSKKNGLDDVQAQANKLNLGHVGQAIDGVKGKFSALSVVGVTALATIANRAVSAGLNIAKSLTISPIMQGFQEYETQLNSVQTILANTAAAGTNLKDVNGALNTLNHYADQTIYNFSEMTRNIGTFTAAGVDLKTATSSIKGIANLAALSGSNSQQASTAMYQLSQAISAGRVGLQDWNSVVNAGMGGSVFQRALAQTAQTMGTIKKGALELKGPMKNVVIDGKSFRESITAKPGQKSWLTSKVLTNTLKQFTGDLSLAQIKAMGFSDAQAKTIQAQARTAQDAATKVKTITQLMDTLKEAVGSGWSATFQTIFGNFTEAKTLFTGLSKTFGGIISRSSNARNKVLRQWKKQGGRDNLILALSDAGKILGSVIGQIKDAFRDIFPRKTGADLAALTLRFTNFIISLTPGRLALDTIHDIFKGFFSVLDIGKQILGGVFGVFKKLFGTVAHGSGGLIDFLLRVAYFFTDLDQNLKNGEALPKFFDKVGDALAVPFKLLGVVKGFIVGLFDGFDAPSAKQIEGSLKGVGDQISRLSIVSDKVGDFLGKVKKKLQPFTDGIVKAFHQLGQNIKDAIAGTSFQDVMSALQTGLFAGLVLLVKKFFSNGINVDLGGGFLGKISETLEALTDKTKAMTQEIKANTLLKIAGAIGILAASVVLLASVDPSKLGDALKAMAVGFGELLGAMAILTKISGSAGFVKVPIIASSMLILAAAIGVLVLSMKLLATMSWDELKKGLTGVGVLLASISVAVLIMSKSSGGMLRVGLGIAAIAVAMNLLAGAVKIFSTMKWGEIGKGLGAMGALLGGIAVAMRLMPKGLFAQSVGILAISVAMNLLAGAMKIFATMSWQDMAKGLVGVAGGLTAIAAGMRLMPRRMVLQSVALLAISAALTVLAGALKIMASMSWEEMGRGLATLGGALGLLAGGLQLMSGTLIASVALVAAAGAIALLTPSLKVLSTLSWDAILHGMAALGGALGILALAGVAIEPGVIGLIGLGVAVVAIGAGIGIAAAGIGLLADGLALLADKGSDGVSVILKALTGLIKQIPALAIALAKGLVQFVVVIGKSTPQLVKAIGSLVAGMLKVLVDNIPAIVAAAVKLILTLVQAITDNAPKLITKVSDMALSLLTALQDNLPRLIEGAFEFIISFLNGLADAIEKNTPKLIKAVFNLGIAVVKGLWNGISGFAGWVWDKISSFFSGLWDKVLDFFGVHSPSRLAADLGQNIVKGIWNGITGLASWLLGLVTGFFKGIWKGITAVFSGAIDLGKNILGWIGKGVSAAVTGLKNLAVGALKGIWNGIKDVFSGAVNLGKNILGWIGRGISAAVGGLKNLAVGAAKSVYTGLSTVFSHGASIGSSFMSVIGGGISGATGTLIGKANVTFDAVNNAAKNHLKGHETGFHFSEGLAQGIADGKYLVIAKAEDVSSGALAVAGTTMKIQSPSRVMMWMGKMFTQGLANGISGGAKNVNASAQSMATGAIGIMNNSLSKAPSSLDVNMNPTITPVLDLSNVRKNASSIGGILGNSGVTARVSYSQADGLATDRQSAAADGVDLTQGKEATSLTFEQNNYSPKALAPIEIYRNTKSQINQAKEALGL